MERPDLRRLSAAPRALGLGFLISLGLAYAVALLFVFVQTDMRPRGIAERYRGDAAVPGDAAAPGYPVDPAASDPGVGAPADPAGVGAGAAQDGPAADPFTEEPAGLGQEWRGRGEGMKFAKSLKDMILTTHLHMLSISTILLLVGGFFACSSFPERAKPWVIGAGFAGLVFTYAGMWAVRYASPAFAPAVFLFGTVQALSMATQMLAGLKDLILPAPKSP